MRFLARLVHILFLASMFLLLSVTMSHAQEGGALADSVPADELDASAANTWMNLVYDRIQADAVNAPAVSRLYAYAAITLYESVVHGIPGNASLGGQINELPQLPVPAEDAVYDWYSVVDASMITVLSHIFSTSPDSIQAFTDLHDANLATQAANHTQDVIDRSVTYGETLGAALLAWMDGDHYAERITTYTVPTDDPSTWVFTNPDLPPVEPDWGSIRTLFLPEATTCDVENDVPFSTEEDSLFYVQAMEVYNVGKNLTQEQMDIAEFWIDTPGETGAPSGHWIHIAGDLILQEEMMLDHAAELYVVVAMSLMDANIATWNYKYAYPLIRPITYIRQYIDPRWQTYLETPMFPEYPSGHSVVSGTAATTLTNYFGGANYFTNTNITPSGIRTRSFTSFWHAAAEGGISRLYGGIHYRAAIENGLEMGRCIGNYLFDVVHLHSEQ